MLDLVGFVLNLKKLELDLTTGYPVSWCSVGPGTWAESIPPRVREIIVSKRILSYQSVPVHGFTQLGFRSYLAGSSVPEAVTMSFSFLRSDKPIFTTT